MRFIPYAKAFLIGGLIGVVLAYLYNRYIPFESHEEPKNYPRGNIVTADGTVIASTLLTSHGEIRQRPHGNTLTPILGYTRTIYVNNSTYYLGIKGLEKFFDEELMTGTGDSLHINISYPLQTSIESRLDQYKKEFDAQEVLASVMESGSGKIIAMASSNRFNPSHITREKYASLNQSAIEYSHEPGSVIKPIVYALLLDKGLITSQDKVDGHNGHYVFHNKTIVDENKIKMMNAEDAIIYSSSIGMAQLAQKLNGHDYVDGLQKFGMTRFSGIELPYEKRGSIPSERQLSHPLYKAVTSYGYGLRANSIQLIKAFNTFNNDGRMVAPMIVGILQDHDGKTVQIQRQKPVQVISPTTAAEMKRILMETVDHGTGTLAKTSGLEIGGKTGTAHIFKDHKYTNNYNTTFVGFANDKTHRYTIGITVIDPKTVYYSSMTAVPVFKSVVDAMMKQNYLKVDQIKSNQIKSNQIK